MDTNTAQNIILGILGEIQVANVAGIEKEKALQLAADILGQKIELTTATLENQYADENAQLKKEKADLQAQLAEATAPAEQPIEAEEIK